MCGRYVSTATADEIAAHFDAMVAPETAADPDLSERYNVAPTTNVYVVGERIDPTLGDRQRLVRAHRWGLVPSWAKTISIGNKMINARAETVATTNAYRGPFRRKRCLIPADGFYEWRAVPNQPRKQPVFIRRRDRQPLAFAGLWSIWHDADDVVHRSCAIITTAANETIAPVHDRMPVILPAERWAVWLDPANEDVDALLELLVPAPDELLEWWDVDVAVGNVRNDRPDLTAPADGGDRSG